MSTAYLYDWIYIIYGSNFRIIFGLHYYLCTAFVWVWIQRYFLGVHCFTELKITVARYSLDIKTTFQDSLFLVVLIWLAWVMCRTSLCSIYIKSPILLVVGDCEGSPTLSCLLRTWFRHLALARWFPFGKCMPMWYCER